MLSIGVLVVGSLVNSFEVPRVEKFQGALAPSAELERLVEQRPSYVVPATVLAAGGTLMIPAILMWSFGFGASVNGGAGGAILALSGLIVGGVALAAIVVSSVILIVFAVVRGNLDARIRELEKTRQREPGLAPPPVSPSVNAAPLSTLLLARF